ncbi:MAG: hypothetical protein AB7I01_07760 [Gammaproteobacteria bacterium]
MNTYVVIAAAVAMGMTSGCTASRHKVIAATGTVIGLEVAQSPANQSPQAKLGYNRAELAIVPTNRNDEPAAGGNGTGASDVADVLMELKYQGLLGGSSSGIYQRLAVGSEAVTQPGAWLMFLKDAQGTVSAANASALEKAMEAVPTAEATQTLGDLARGFSAADSGTQQRYDAAAKSAGFASFQAFLAAKPTAAQATKVRDNFVAGN